MDRLALQIWLVLDSQRDFIPIKDVAASVGLSERALRADGDQPSLLEVASRQIFEQHGAVIITRTGKPSGVKLSKNPLEIQSAIRQMSGHLNSEKRRVEFWEECVHRITRGQLSLAI